MTRSRRSKRAEIRPEREHHPSNFEEPRFEGDTMPAFKPGHWVSTFHGAYSSRLVEPMAKEIEEGALQVAADNPEFAWLAEPAFRPALGSWATAQARIERLRVWLDEHGDLDDEGNVRGAANFLVRVEGQALKFAQELGLTPAAAARLQRDASQARVNNADLATALANLNDEDR